jgi:hypothetical protein
MVPWSHNQEIDMKQEIDISGLELTTEKLNDVSGGQKNSQTEAFHVFMAGIVKG